MDFGIAGLANNFNVDKIDVGSLKYMAPETLSGKNTKIGPSIDVWAIGVILYGLTVGSLPFKGKSVQEIKLSIMVANYQLPPKFDLSNDYKDLISRIFIIDPMKRIKINDILNHPWMLRIDNAQMNHKISQDFKAIKVNTIVRESTVKFIDGISITFIGLEI